MKTKEGNKLIAEFMGIEHYFSNGYENYIYADDNHRTDIDLWYHESWNWLMPVVEKVATLLANNAYVGYFSNKDWFTIFMPQDFKVENLWSDVVHFLEWYNEQSPVMGSFDENGDTI